jgi:hypothetical protein
MRHEQRNQAVELHPAAMGRRAPANPWPDTSPEVIALASDWGGTFTTAAAPVGATCYMANAIS